jgi:hypothetical protein
MKKKFKIIDASTGIAGGKPFKLSEGQMIVMNGDGVFFLVGGIGDYYMGIQRLSDVCPVYEVIWNC